MKKEDKGQTEPQKIIEKNNSITAEESIPPPIFAKEQSKPIEKKVETPEKTSAILQQIKFCDYGLGKVCPKCGSKKVTDSNGTICAIADDRNCPMLKK